jgi:4-diphosphocytidyl-2-C-methyl-D-erythritol kinase
MILFTGCKINLGLAVTGRRKNGYHIIESLLYPINWNDIVEVVPAKEFGFSLSGMELDIAVDENICVKAYNLLKEKYDIPPVKIHLHKVISFGAGLGGGSSDAVAVLKLINNIYSLKISKMQMHELAAALGSDCPFFIENKPVIAKGSGTELQPSTVDLNRFYIVIIKPPVSVSTAEAYARIRSYSADDIVVDALKRNVAEWKDFLVNDFEEPVFKLYPALQQIKEMLYEKGAVYASMSGSGSAIFGIFEEMPDLKNTDSEYVKVVNPEIRPLIT